MRILLATDLYTPAVNGVVTSTLSLKHSLEKLGHEVRVLTLTTKQSIHYAEDVYTVSSLNMNKVYPGARVSLFTNRKVEKEILDWQPDIIHTQSEFSTFRMAKQLATALDIPIVHTYHTIYEDYTHYFSPTKKAGRKIVATLTKKFMEDVEAIIAPTNKVKRLLQGYAVTPPISVIPTGIQLQAFKETFSTEDQMIIRKKYGIPNNAFLLLSLGRLGKEKNIEELLHYLAFIKKDIYFLIAGDGPNRFELMAYAETLSLEKHVKFVGMVDPENVAAYYKTADLFVSASTSETQGLTYIEAMASGLPALCRRDESIENVIIDGFNGYQYSSFKEFESCLYYLMQNKAVYQSMAFNAQQFIFNHFSSQAFGQQVETVYQKALETYYVRQAVNHL